MNHPIWTMLLLLALTPAICRGEETPLPITGVANPNLSPLDDMMTRFLREHSVPGAALAVSRRGVLVYARGFGSRNVEQAEPVLPSTSFRIASITKPITAAAILSLVQAEKIGLDDKLSDRLAPADRAAMHERLGTVTVRQLLQHRGGWDRTITPDPMFRTMEIGKQLGLSGPANQQQLIRYMLTRAPDFEPGTRFAYSNFGYCLLGRVIEEASGESYEAYVQQQVFAPLGIRGVQLAKSLTVAEGESHYYQRSPELKAGVVPGVIGQQVPPQYGGWSLEIMAAHGGWIASAPALVAFADAFHTPSRLEFLTPNLIAQTFARPVKADIDPVYYGLGWQVRQRGEAGGINTWHNGALPGTSTLLVRRHDGFNWAVLFNSRRGSDGRELATAIDPLVHRAVDSIETWPERAVEYAAEWGDGTSYPR